MVVMISAFRSESKTMILNPKHLVLIIKLCGSQYQTNISCTSVQNLYEIYSGKTLT